MQNVNAGKHARQGLRRVCTTAACDAHHLPPVGHFDQPPTSRLGILAQHQCRHRLLLTVERHESAKVQLK